VGDTTRRVPAGNSTPRRATLLPLLLLPRRQGVRRRLRLALPRPARPRPGGPPTDRIGAGNN
jgi:hypothetical protein